MKEGEEAIIPSIASLQLRKERKGMRRETYDLYDEETKCSWGREGRGERKKIPCKVGKGLHRQGGCTREVWLVLTTYMKRHATACSNITMRKFKDCFDFRSAFRPVYVLRNRTPSPTPRPPDSCDCHSVPSMDISVGTSASRGYGRLKGCSWHVTRSAEKTQKHHAVVLPGYAAPALPQDHE